MGIRLAKRKIIAPRKVSINDPKVRKDRRLHTFNGEWNLTRR